MLATIVAKRPTTSPSASIRCHFFSTSAGLADLVVFISAFMALILSLKCERRRTGAAPSAGYLPEGAGKSSKCGHLPAGKMIPCNVRPRAKRLQLVTLHDRFSSKTNRGASYVYRSWRLVDPDPHSVAARGHLNSALSFDRPQRS